MAEERFPGFVLRYAAGRWRLLDLTHPGLAYKEPLVLNDSGAEIFEKLDQGLEPPEIAADLSGTYGISQAEVLEDIRGFMKELAAFGLPLEQ